MRMHICVERRLHDVSGQPEPNRIDGYKSEIILKGNYFFAYIPSAMPSAMVSVINANRLFLWDFFSLFEIDFCILLRCSVCLFL